MKRFLEYVRFVMRSKGACGVLPRVGMLLARFDVSGCKMLNAVAGINALGAKYDFKPAMIVPAVVLRRRKRLLKYASDSNLEFALHGHTHRNHRPWSLEQQCEEIEKAKAVFEKLRMPYCGFRAPYLSCNADTDKALEMCGIRWNSDQAMMWDYESQRSRDNYSTGEAVDILYRPQNAAQALAIPHMHGAIACIPLVLPDDEILIDRFGITDEDRITEIWASILEQSHARGDIFVLQLHPERFSFCAKAMDALLERCVEKQAWITGLREVSEWWKERSKFTFDITLQPDGSSEVKCTCAPRATVLVRNAPETGTPFRSGYEQMSTPRFRLATDGRRPCIGIAAGCSHELHAFVKELGFACEVSNSNSGYSLFLDADESYSPEREVELLERIERCEAPLLRYWLWPDGHGSAFATSHDLDCVTLTDFAYRTLGY